MDVFGILSLVRRYSAWRCSCYHENYCRRGMYSVVSGRSIFQHGAGIEGCGTEAAFNKQKSLLVSLISSQSPRYIQIIAIRASQCHPASVLRNPVHKSSNHISYRYITPAALLFSLYSSKLLVPPSATGPSSLFISFAVFTSHSSSSPAMICSKRCCWPLAK